MFWLSKPSSCIGMRFGSQSLDLVSARARRSCKRLQGTNVTRTCSLEKIMSSKKNQTAKTRRITRGWLSLPDQTRNTFGIRGSCADVAVLKRHRLQERRCRAIDPAKRSALRRSSCLIFTLGPCELPTQTTSCLMLVCCARAASRGRKL